jgi:Tat protein secretion system quality control protein TatD with DNase activity
MSEDSILPSKDILEHIVDVHCHPTDEIEIADDVMTNLHIKICAMATNSEDQQRVAELARRFPGNVRIPSYSCGIDLTRL